MAISKAREAVVAGQFYPAQASELNRQIKSFIDEGHLKIDALACVMPHAGYVYSGAVAGATVSRVNVKERIILLGPNHTGLGGPFSIVTEGSWRTPLGDVEIDASLAKNILSSSNYLKEDALAHANEHSLEVELPFLQYFRKDIKITPIAFMSEDLKALKQVGVEIAETVLKEKLEKSTLIIASSDMTHYEAQVKAQEQDKQAISAILELNEDKLMERVRSLNISMCGYMPVIVMLSCAKALGARKAELVKYQTSADVTKDYSSVVGYAGVIIY